MAPRAGSGELSTEGHEGLSASHSADAAELHPDVYESQDSLEIRLHASEGRLALDQHGDTLGHSPPDSQSLPPVPPPHEEALETLGTAGLPTDLPSLGEACSETVAPVVQRLESTGEEGPQCPRAQTPPASAPKDALTNGLDGLHFLLRQEFSVLRLALRDSLRESLTSEFRSTLTELLKQHRELLEWHESLVKCSLDAYSQWASNAPAEDAFCFGNGFKKTGETAALTQQRHDVYGSNGNGHSHGHRAAAAAAAAAGAAAAAAAATDIQPGTMSRGVSAKCEESWSSIVPDGSREARISVLPGSMPEGQVLERGQVWERKSVARGQHSVVRRKCSMGALGAGRNGTDKKKEPKMLMPKTGAFGDLLCKKPPTDLDVEEYDVANFYHTSGLAQWLAKHDGFNNMTLGVIFCNAVFIGVNEDHNDAETLMTAPLAYQLLEHAFCFYFSMEWVVRFSAFARKRDCLKDNWFKFDTALVFMMVLETWVMTGMMVLAGMEGSGLPAGPIKMVRLLRLARMNRLARALPELVTMIKGMKVAARAILCSLLLLVMLVYIFAIIMHMFLASEYPVSEYFATVPLSMWTLLLDGTLMDSPGIVLGKLRKGDYYFMITIFFIFQLLSAMLVMNMLIGVLCEVVTAVAAHEKEDAAIRLMKGGLLGLLKELDKDGSGEISHEEMRNVFEDPSAVMVLKSLDVDVGYLFELGDWLFQEEGTEIPIDQVMELILNLRGDSASKVQDVIDITNFHTWKLKNEMHAVLTKQKDDFEGALNRIAASIPRPKMIPPLPTPPPSRPALQFSLTGFSGGHGFSSHSDAPKPDLLF